MSLLFLLLSLILIVSSDAIKTKLTWVNGIAHNLDHMKEGSHPINYRFNTNVDFCYNPTSMTTETDYLGFLGDLSQAGFQKLGRITQEVDALVEHLRKALDFVGKKGKVVHIAHSQGAIITALAAKNLTESEMKQIEVISFGGGTALTRDEFPHFSRIVNYYAINDPLLFIVPAASRALRTGFAFSAITGEQEFVFLTPRLGDPALDHGLMGETYLEALTWEGRRYQILYQNAFTRTVRPLSLLLMICASNTMLGINQGVSLFVARYVLPIIIIVWKYVLLIRDKIYHAAKYLYISCIIPIWILFGAIIKYLVCYLSGDSSNFEKYK